LQVPSADRWRLMIPPAPCVQTMVVLLRASTTNDVLWPEVSKPPTTTGGSHTATVDAASVPAAPGGTTATVGAATKTGATTAAAILTNIDRAVIAHLEAGDSAIDPPSPTLRWSGRLHHGPRTRESGPLAQAAMRAVSAEGTRRCRGTGRMTRMSNVAPMFASAARSVSDAIAQIPRDAWDCPGLGEW